MKYAIEESNLTAIADAIRAKNGTSEQYTPAQMAGAIQKITGSGSSSKQWTVDVVTSTTGFKFLHRDSWLAEHRNDENLCICIVGDKIANGGSTSGIGGVLFGTNMSPTQPALNKMCMRWSASRQVWATDSIVGTLTNNTSIIRLTETGTLECYSMTFGGTYYITAWIAGSNETIINNPPEINSKRWIVNAPTAVARTYTTLVSGDSDVAQHYADDTAVCTVIKLTNLTSNGIQTITTRNISSGMSQNAQVSVMAGWDAKGNVGVAGSNTLELKYEKQPSSSSADYKVTATPNGDIKVLAGSLKTNFGNADYLIVFSW